MRLSLLPIAAAVTFLTGVAQVQASNYAIDPTHTFVTFEISHFGTSTNRGRFDKKEGTVAFDRAAKTGKVEIVIDTTSINTGTAAFNKHLQSDELFDAAKHPASPLELPLWSGLRLQAQAIARLTDAHHRQANLSAAPALALRDVEAAMIRKALEEARGNVGLAARALGIGRATLYRKLGHKPA